MEERYYLDVPFKEKEKAKALGARWDNEMRQWYYTDKSQAYIFKEWDEGQSVMPTINDLSDEQKRMVEYAKQGNNILVDACIGSGKTTSIQVLCNVLPDKSILYLTYNTLLKLDAKKKIKAKNVTVTNYHGFAYMCLKNAGYNVGISDLIQTYIAKLPENPKKYDLLVLDEYQDIDLEISQMLNDIKKQNPGLQIIAVGDMKQKIYDKTTLNVPSFMQDFLGNYHLLNFTKCFRLNAQHAAMLGRIWEKDIVGVNTNCKVEHMLYPDAKKLLLEADLADILCLGARHGDMAYALNELEKNNKEKFNKDTVYASIEDQDRNVLPQPQNAIFTTFDSSKGLERKYCFVFDFYLDYWTMRSAQPMTKYEILRNIFCVAASRGKDRIIFVHGIDRDGTVKELLKEEDIKVFPTKSSDTDIPYAVSDMFYFRYKEDIENCYKKLKISKINDRSKQEIKIKTHDGLIDLAPCIGIYQEAMFFKNYDIDEQIQFSRDLHPDRPMRKIPYNADIAEKILHLTAFETSYDRYIDQITQPYVDTVSKEKLFARLQSVFDRDEEVQRDCIISFEDESGSEYTIRGRCDVIKDNCIFELKYKSDLEHEDYLQLATYMVSLGYKKGILWNTRTNEMFQVEIPDKKAFMMAVVPTITKHAVTKFYMEKEYYSDFAVETKTEAKSTLSKKVMDFLNS